MVDARGRNSLHWACEYAEGEGSCSDESIKNAMKVVGIVLKAGADYSAKDSKGRTPIEYIEKEHVMPVADWLRGKISGKTGAKTLRKSATSI